MSERPNIEPITSTLETVALELYRDHKKEKRWRLVRRFILLLILLFIIVGVNKETRRENRLTSQPHVAVIHLEGVIDSQNDQADMLHEALLEKDPGDNLKGVILLANSPGGSPVVANIAYEQIQAAREKLDVPIVAVVGDVCASGCYYIISAADAIIADPSSTVGSIGVISDYFDFTGLMEKLGIKRRTHIAGSNKAFGNPFAPETPEHQAITDEMLAQIHQQFIEKVKAGRGDQLKFEEYPDVFSGRPYTGKSAKEVGLIDDFGNLYSVAQNVFDDLPLVSYDRQKTLLNSLSDFASTGTSHILSCLTKP